MKTIRTEPHGYGAEGDERIRTAEQAPSTDPAYERLGNPFGAREEAQT